MWRTIKNSTRHWKIGTLALCGIMIVGADSFAVADRGGFGAGGNGRGGQPSQQPRGGSGGGGQRPQPAPRQSAPRQAPRQSAPRQAPQRPSAQSPNAPRPQQNARPAPQNPSSGNPSRNQQPARSRDVIAPNKSGSNATAPRGNDRPPQAATPRPKSPTVVRPSNQSPTRDVKSSPSRDVKSPNSVRPPSKGSTSLGGQNVIPPTKSTGSGKGGSKPDRPTLVKPTRDAIGKGQSQADIRANPTVKSNTKNPDIIKPVRGGDDRTLGGARPGEALVKPAGGGDPHSLQGFKPGKLQPSDQRSGNGGNAKPNNNRSDPQTVVGLQNRDVRNRNAPPRERVVVNNQQVAYNNHNIIQPVNCGHSFCGGRSNCAYAYDYCSPGNYGWSNYGYGYDNDCDNNWGFSFSVGYSSGNWGFGLGYSNYGYGNYWNVGVGYSNWYSDCNYYRPVYSACGPAYPYYGYNNWCAPVYYARPYYCRPYYSLRYAYGCYAPRYACYSAYTYPAYSSYWWLYDTSDNNYAYSSAYSYSDGYGDGFTQGYETASEQSNDGVGSYEPTWLAGGNSASTGSDAAPVPSNREPQDALPNDGWDLLVAGNARDARRAFDRECMNNPGDGLPQIGYAITAGLMERYDEAVIAMRKALDEDPDAFSEAPRNDKVAEQVRNLLMHYRNVTRENPKDASALFMTAALRHLLGEDALAYFAIDKAMEAGDTDKSSSVLKGLIQRSLDAQPETETPASVPSAIGPMPAAPITVPTATAPRSDQQF